MIDEESRSSRAKAIACLAFALVAFAMNSLLCRAALRNSAIDAGSFTIVRMASGALALGVIAALSRGLRPAVSTGSWGSAAMLAAYAVFFSFAYVSLGAGTGALILFGAVQVTMIGAGLRGGERLRPIAWVGVALAVAGLVYLVLPGLEAPSPSGSLLMAGAGIAWGIYSLRGRRTRDPLAESSGNFLRGLPIAAGAGLVLASELHLSTNGVLLAVASGAVASGLGYVAWYAALGGIAATSAATLQLSVPVLAAFGGVAFLSEPVTIRLCVAAAAILGGVWLSLRRRADREP